MVVKDDPEYFGKVRGGTVNRVFLDLYRGFDINFERAETGIKARGRRVLPNTQPAHVALWKTQKFETRVLFYRPVEDPQGSEWCGSTKLASSPVLDSK